MKPICRLLFLLLAPAALGFAGPPPPARAQEGLWLAWGACAMDPAGSRDQAFDCASNDGRQALYAAFALAQPLDSVLAVEVVVDLQVAGGALPDWWQIGSVGCRGGALGADASFGGSPGCADPWVGGAVVSLPSYTIGMPRGMPGQARIRVGVGVAANQPRALAAGTPYHAVRLLISDVRTDSCGGCATPACLVLNSVLVKRSPGALGGDVLVIAPGPGDGNRATWQGAGADCTAVPVRRRATWGAVKSLYR